MSSDRTSAGPGWIKGVVFVVAIAAAIFILTRLKSAQAQAGEVLSSGVDAGWTEGTQDEVLGQAIAANDYQAVRNRLPQVPKDGIKDTIVAKLSMDRRAEALRAFLDAGWNPNGPTNDGRPIETALSISQFKAVEVLVSHKANVNQRTREGCTPLVMLIDLSNAPVELVEKFVVSGADPEMATNETLRNPYGNAPIPGSVYGPPAKPRPQVGVPGAGRPVRSEITYFSRVAMDVAIANNRPDIIRLLLKHGAKLDLRGKYARSLTEAAAKNQFREGSSYSTVGLVNLLIEQGADIEHQVEMKIRLRGARAVSTMTGTPLYFAALRGDTVMIPTLLSAKANPATKCEGGKTPLEVATVDALALLRNKPPGKLAGLAKAGPEGH